MFANTIVHPWTVMVENLERKEKLEEDSVVKDVARMSKYSDACNSNCAFLSATFLEDHKTTRIKILCEEIYISIHANYFPIFNL